VLYELCARSAEITRGTETRLVVNDRADIARTAGADGVHLSTRSLEASVVRRAFGEDFLIGVSTHTLAEARAARDGGANFAVFGPVFDTPSKRALGTPIGLNTLGEVTRELSPFPIFAIGGITRANAPHVILAGARGVAAIRLLADAETLPQVVAEIEQRSD
jgi:thiamine-phosphate pyrophosphorylase